MSTWKNFCVECGMPVDLRKDHRIPADFAVLMGVLNERYHFVHERCRLTLANKLKADQNKIDQKEDGEMLLDIVDPRELDY